MKKLSLLIILFIIHKFSFAFEVQHIETDDYFNEIARCIKSAEKEILIILHNFSSSYSDSNAPVLKVIQSFSLAALEGIKITCILNPDYKANSSSETTNDNGFDLIKTSGANIEFVDDSHLLTSSMIIFDSNTIVIGGPPWTDSRQQNHYFYTAMKISDTDLASHYKNIFTSIPKKDLFFKKSKTPFKGKVVALNNNLFRKKHFAELLKLKPEFTYFLLYLMGKDADKHGRWFKLASPKDLCRRFFEKSKTRLQARDFIIKALKRLKKMKLITWKKGKDKLIAVQFTNPGGYVHTPLGFYRFNYYKNMNIKELIIYLDLIRRASFENSFPDFSVNDNLFKTFAPLISKEQHMRIFRQLQKKLMITPSGKIHNNSLLFSLLPPPSPETIKNNIQLLKHDVGEEALKKVQILASQLDKEMDTEVLRDIIYYIKELGLIETQKSFHSILSLPFLHPDRRYHEVKKDLIEKLHHKIKLQ